VLLMLTAFASPALAGPAPAAKKTHKQAHMKYDYRYKAPNYKYKAPKFHNHLLHAHTARKAQSH